VTAAKKKTSPAKKRKPTKRGLTEKEKVFAEAYMVNGFNATRAYLKAYPKTKNENLAAVKGHTLLRKGKVAEYLDKRKAELRERAKIDEDRILKEEACLALLDIGKLFGDDGTLVAPNELPEEVRRAVSSVQITETVVEGEVTGRKFRYKFWDKGKSLERVSRMLGLYKDRLGIDGDLTIRDALDEISREKDGLPDIS